MTKENIENLKGKFFKHGNDKSSEYLYIEDIEFYNKDKDDEFVVELRIISINKRTVDGRRRLESYGFDGRGKINQESCSSIHALEKIWNLRQIEEISSDEFKKEFLTYFDETYYRIFNETPN